MMFGTAADIVPLSFVGWRADDSLGPDGARLWQKQLVGVPDGTEAVFAQEERLFVLEKLQYYEEVHNSMYEST